MSGCVPEVLTSASLVSETFKPAHFEEIKMCHYQPVASKPATQFVPMVPLLFRLKPSNMVSAATATTSQYWVPEVRLNGERGMMG